MQFGRQTRYGAVTKDGQGEAVIGMVIMLKGANSKEVVERVKAEIPEIQKALPPGVKIVPFYDRTDLIQACIKTCNRLDKENATLVRIKNTISLDVVEISESLIPAARCHGNLEVIGAPYPLPFDEQGNLVRPGSS